MNGLLRDTKALSTEKVSLLPFKTPKAIFIYKALRSSITSEKPKKFNSFSRDGSTAGITDSETRKSLLIHHAAQNH